MEYRHPNSENLKHEDESKYNVDSTLLHIGYFRDSPNEPPVFLASNSAGEGPRITPLADNIFGAVYQFLTKVELPQF